ncbi:MULTISPECIES: DUF4331 family protein [Bradyrhizobium]|uniref:DUF4331 domain-containing protein n=2 Tax=Bradyrhizobium TaxID=374 RepID=A0ABY0PEZ8_9BRAD|nr:MULTISPECIES: DUF4331 family protein [Bradyrhizobium]SDI24495.1 protein of unknown function [Bradyrhizobium ottawaense]SED70828.1 protein of unknown function [Bradyrhizobium lablabi]SHL66955.1 protein of unknown function [Bradyrhizobium lablabi]
MSDHFSGPRSLSDPAADITDVFAFPCPDSPQHLVLAMDVFGKAGPSALFSDAVIYRFRVRPAAIAETGPMSSFAIGTDEAIFDCVFEVPSSLKDGSQPKQHGRCMTPSGEVIQFCVNDEKGGNGNDVQVFAGQRSEPFFLDVRMIEKTVATGQLAFKKVGSDTLYGTNILAIVLKVEWRTLLKGGPMFAVVCETLASGKRPVRIERVGRPEIKNVSLSWKMFDQVNRDLEIRDLYNSEDAFKLATDYFDAYRVRMNANLTFYDGLDGKIDWPANEQGNHPLTKILLADFLVVDASKPLTELSYFEIERSMLKDRIHVTAGGRWLNEDIMDSIFTLYVNGGNGPRVDDGIAGPITWSSKVFPYMAPPNPPRVVAS